MTLRELLASLDTLDKAFTIYAQGGVNAAPNALAVTALEPEDGPTPLDVEGVEYLLEVAEACEVMEVWSEWRGGEKPTPDQSCEAIVHYARRDAYLPVASVPPTRTRDS